VHGPLGADHGALPSLKMASCDYHSFMAVLVFFKQENIPSDPCSSSYVELLPVSYFWLALIVHGPLGADHGALSSLKMASCDYHSFMAVLVFFKQENIPSDPCSSIPVSNRWQKR